MLFFQWFYRKKEKKDIEEVESQKEEIFNLAEHLRQIYFTRDEKERFKALIEAFDYIEYNRKIHVIDKHYYNISDEEHEQLARLGYSHLQHNGVIGVLACTTEIPDTAKMRKRFAPN